MRRTRPLRTEVLLVLFVLWLLQCFESFSVLSSVVAFSANIICNRITGLTSAQRKICQTRPDAIVAIGEGAKMGQMECQRQFRSNRWNCTALGTENGFGYIVVVGSREAAYVYAVISAGMTYSVTKACGRGNLTQCGCDRSKEGVNLEGGWKWGGCSADVKYGMRLARKFLDAREVEGDERSLMNLHNNKAGRKAVKHNMLMECKCHGVSGSCTMKTCWKMLPPFAQVGDYLMERYQKARKVTSYKGRRQGVYRHSYLRLKKPRNLLSPRGINKGLRPKPRDLVYLQNSSDFCEPDPAKGSLGTRGRLCNSTSKGSDSCKNMCCERGFTTYQHTKSYQCHCKFHWCCYVNCLVCRERTQISICK